MKAAGLGVEGGHRARSVDPDQPVRFGAADGGVGQRTHLRIGAQGGEGFADGGRSHRLEPEAADGLFGAGVADDVAKDQFAFPARVAGVDQGVDVLAFDQFGQQL